MQTLLTLMAPAAAPVNRVPKPAATITSPGAFLCEDMITAFAAVVNKSVSEIAALARKSAESATRMMTLAQPAINLSYLVASMKGHGTACRSNRSVHGARKGVRIYYKSEYHMALPGRSKKQLVDQGTPTAHRTVD